MQIDLEEVFKHYLIAAVWSSTLEDGNPMDNTHSFNDFNPVVLENLKEEVVKFCNQHAELLTQFAAALPQKREWTESAQIGHDLWLTQNGHGAGFWDRGCGEAGENLSRLVGHGTEFSPTNLYIGDDGKIYAYGYESPKEIDVTQSYEAPSAP
jgi:hypothetical protein